MCTCPNHADQCKRKPRPKRRQCSICIDYCEPVRVHHPTCAALDWRKPCTCGFGLEVINS